MLKQTKQNIPDPRGKFRLNQEGSYLVKTILLRGSIKLMDFEGNKFSEPINTNYLVKKPKKAS